MRQTVLMLGFVTALSSNTPDHTHHSRRVCTVVSDFLCSEVELSQSCPVVRRNYKRLFLDGPREKMSSSPRSVASSDHSRTQSPPSAWNVAPQSETSAAGQSNSTWNQTDRPNSPPAQFPLSHPRVHHSSFLNESQTRQLRPFLRPPPNS